MILVVIAALLGVVIGLALPKISPSIGEITGEYIAFGPAVDALNGLQVDDRPDSTGYDRDSFGFRATDDDGDGCDVRDDVLARDLTDVIFSAAKRCQVSSVRSPTPTPGRPSCSCAAETPAPPCRSTTSWRSQTLAIRCQGLDHCPALPLRQRPLQSARRGWPRQPGQGIRLRRLLASHQRRVSLRIRRAADRRQTALRSDRHHQREAFDARVLRACPAQQIPSQ